MVKNLPASSEDAGFIPGAGRSPGEGNGSSLAWEISWTEELGGLHSVGSEKVRRDIATKQQHLILYLDFLHQVDSLVQESIQLVICLFALVREDSKDTS